MEPVVDQIMLERLYIPRLSLRCIECNLLFQSHAVYRQHMEEHGDLQPYHCTQCTKSFNRRDKLMHHIRQVHNREKNVYCDVCGKGFFDNTGLKSHMRVHTGEKRYSCHICQRPLSSKQSLKQHIISKHSKNSKRRTVGKWHRPTPPALSKTYSELHPFSR